jgi:hypothetical protein
MHSHTKYSLIPHLNIPLRPRRKHLTRLLLRPRHTRNRPPAAIRLHLVVHLARLEVPETHIPARIARHHKLAVRTTRKPNGAAGRVVPAPRLLAVLPEFIRSRRVRHDRVVGALVQHVLAARVLRRLGERKHVGFTEKLASS